MDFLEVVYNKDEILLACIFMFQLTSYIRLLELGFSSVVLLGWFVKISEMHWPSRKVQLNCSKYFCDLMVAHYNIS